MDIVCDTNVWYDIGMGRLDPSGLKATGVRLFASPVTLIEIASELEERTFEERKQAATAVAEEAHGILVDPERHLAGIWSLPVEPLDIDWEQGFKAIAQCAAVSDLERGVADFTESVIRRVDHRLAHYWKNYHYDDFAKGVEQVVDGIFPGYLSARRAGRIKYMKKSAAKPFEKLFLTNEFLEAIVLSTRARASLHLADAPEEPTDSEVVRARVALTPYALAYGRLLLKTATTCKVEPNDWGDLEAFVYLQDGRKLLTRDKKWIQIAQESGLGSLLVFP